MLTLVGHWIQACPTNDDATYDNKNRIKRTTGIPRSMLKKIDQADIDKLDESQRQNLMVNAEGEYVFAQADEKAWKKHLEQVKAAEAAQKQVQVGNKELQDRGLECSIDKRLFVDPMKTPCCGRTYCHDCIENALLDSDLTCPGCGTENISLEALEPDEELKTKIKAYQEEKNNDKQRSRSPTVAASTPQADAGEDIRPATRDGSKSPASINGQSKKRTADEANEKSPENLSAPALKRQKSGEGSTVGTPQADTGNPSTPADTGNANTNSQMNNSMPFMPPDMSQMQNMGMNFPMMPMMTGMPFMPNMMNVMNGMSGTMPNMMPNMMGMNMPIMPNMNQQFPTQDQNQHHSGNWNQHKNNQYRNKPRPFQRHNQAPPQQTPTQPPEGLSGVPTGPKAMQTQGPGGFNPPSGPSANKFSNQQRYTGKEEDNAYLRQPLNPQRQWQKNKRGRPREADYREL
jgi:protein MPE1